MKLIQSVATLKNLQHNFPKMRGGVQGRLELFRKFIRFGWVRHPSIVCLSPGTVRWWGEAALQRSPRQKHMNIGLPRQETFSLANVHFVWPIILVATLVSLSSSRSRKIKRFHLRASLLRVAWFPHKAASLGRHLDLDRCLKVGF